jgi:hypothetical protein
MPARITTRRTWWCTRSLANPSITRAALLAFPAWYVFPLFAD